MADNSCCATVTDFVKNKDHQLSTFTELPLADVLPLLALLPGFVARTPLTVDAKAAHFLHYKPPLIVCDLPVRLQTFLC